MSEQTNPRRADSLPSLIAEVQGYAAVGGELDDSERDALRELSARSVLLMERLTAVIDWADFAMLRPAEFDAHGVRNLDGPVFDAAREALVLVNGLEASARANSPSLLS